MQRAASIRKYFHACLPTFCRFQQQMLTQLTISDGRLKFRTTCELFWDGDNDMDSGLAFDIEGANAFFLSAEYIAVQADCRF